MKKTNRKSGFTLVELMIVAAIIAILAAIIIPLLTKNRDKAVAADGQNLLGTLATALKVYYANTGDATPTIAEMTTADALVMSELGKSKYFDTPEITSVTATSTGFQYVLTAGLRSAVGAFAASDTLILTVGASGAPVWSGNIATVAKLSP